MIWEYLKSSLASPMPLGASYMAGMKPTFEQGQLMKLDRGSHRALRSAKSPLGTHTLPPAQDSASVAVCGWR